MLLKILKELEAKKAALQSGLTEFYTRIPIANSFSIQLDLLSSKADGRFEIDVFQSYGHTAGYRLAYNAGASPSFELLRFGRAVTLQPVERRFCATLRFCLFSPPIEKSGWSRRTHESPFR